MASDRLSLRLPEPLRSGMENLSELTGRTESDLVREAIGEYLSRHATMPTCYDLAQQFGVIGCVTSGKGDLSTNPKHMEGFGQ
jgi:metal-responsive CopG/Arc/MetJ family transcriptional regulator